MTDLATEKQIEYIKTLGGTPRDGLTIEEASNLIKQLKSNVPPTEKQIDFLTQLGAPIPPGLTRDEATRIISELDGQRPPTKQQIEHIKMLGGDLPATKKEAAELCVRLEATAPATEQQKKRAQELGVALPIDATFRSARELMQPLERDADKEDGKPPTKTQLDRIVKLGGDTSKAVNNWRTEQYIQLLDEQRDILETRAEDALETYFGDPQESKDTMSVKKPSKKIMEKALLLGDSQGWGKDWEDPSNSSGLNPYALMDCALYSASPELLRSGEKPPRAIRPAGTKPKGRGCAIVIGVVILILVLIVWRMLSQL